MNVVKCELAGLMVIEPKVFGDARGFFMETWNQSRYQEAGIAAPFVQVDLRRSSPTFGRWHGLELSSETKRQFYIPPGFAHGFLVLSETALFHYKCTEFYSPKDENTIRWDDPDIGIKWPSAQPTLSEKDAKGQRLRDVPRERLFW